MNLFYRSVKQNCHEGALFEWFAEKGVLDGDMDTKIMQYLAKPIKMYTSSIQN